MQQDKKMVFVIKTDHMVDVITNSSSELFVIKNNEDYDTVKGIINSFLKNDDFDEDHYDTRERTVDSIFSTFVKIEPGKTSDTFVDDLPTNEDEAFEKARLDLIGDEVYKKYSDLEYHEIDWNKIDRETDAKFKQYQREVKLSSLNGTKPNVPKWFLNKKDLIKKSGELDYKEKYYGCIIAEGEDYQISDSLGEFIRSSFNATSERM